jgi:hypothetical protein
MKEKDENILPQDKDRHLDVPGEALRDNSINFLEVEESNDNRGGDRRDDETKERQRQWKEGLEEGRKAANSNRSGQEDEG